MGEGNKEKRNTRNEKWKKNNKGKEQKNNFRVINETRKKEDK